MQRARLGVLAVCLICCDAGPDPEPAPTPEPPAREREREPPVVEPPALAPVELEPPVAPAFQIDVTSVREATVRVVAVHRDGSWRACGILHSTGVIEVELLDAGEPPPRVALIVSCPVDWNRDLYVVGKILRVKLFARKQSWPRPPADRKLPAELPRRYVKSLTEVLVSPAPE